MGVWCDFDRNRRTEKTGAIHALNIAVARMNFQELRDGTLLGELLALDFGRLMGVACSITPDRVSRSLVDLSIYGSITRSSINDITTAQAQRGLTRQRQKLFR